MKMTRKELIRRIISLEHFVEKERKAATELETAHTFKHIKYRLEELRKNADNLEKICTVMSCYNYSPEA